MYPVPPEQARTPSNARLYDVAQDTAGHQHHQHYGVERDALARFMRRWGAGLPGNAVANRAFLERAVRLVASSGVNQFLDLGCAYPTTDSPNVHELAQAADPAATVVYVDSDPTVLAHWRVLTPTQPRITYIEADVRDAEQILSHEDTRRLVDWSRPVCVLAVTTLHYLADADDPASLVGRYVRDAAVGSHLVISHIASDGAPAGLVEDLAELYRGGMHTRTAAAIEGLLQGWELLEPGRLVDVRDWRPDGEAVERSPLPLLCGVAAKR